MQRHGDTSGSRRLKHKENSPEIKSLSHTHTPLYSTSSRSFSALRTYQPHLGITSTVTLTQALLLSQSRTLNTRHRCAGSWEGGETWTGWGSPTTLAGKHCPRIPAQNNLLGRVVSFHGSRVCMTLKLQWGCMSSTRLLIDWCGGPLSPGSDTSSREGTRRVWPSHT